MSDLYKVIESEFDLIDDSNESELLEFNFMPIKKAVFKLISDHKKLQAENAELKKQSNMQVRKVLCEIGTEFENDARINKKSMPFVRAIVINKIYDYPTPPEGE